jgi:hypothetical protein
MGFNDLHHNLLARGMVKVSGRDRENARLPPRCQPGPVPGGRAAVAGPKAGATKDYAFFLLAQAAKYLVAQAFSIASHIEIIKEYKTALASMVFNAFCGASPAR